MLVRFLLHDAYIKGGGVLTVTLGLAEALAEYEDVEIVSLFGRDRDPVHQIGADLPHTVLIRSGREGRRAPERPLSLTTPESERLRLQEPSAVVPTGDRRYASYSRDTDQVLRTYLHEIQGGALITMQPGLSVASAALGTRNYLHIAQDHRPFVERPRSIRRAYRERASSYDAFLALTRPDAEGYADLLGDLTRVERMPNGTPLFAGPPSTLDSKVVLAAGRLEHSKGFDLLVDAWQAVASRHPDWSLHIYGRGGEEQALLDQISARGLDRQVRLMGFSPQLQDRMAEASLFVLSSRAEGYGMVLAEAMACGVPVVSTDAPYGPAEVIDHRIDGLLVPNQDIEALSAAIIEMIELPVERRRAMGLAGLAKARERSHAVVAGQWRDLLEECHAMRRPPVRTQPVELAPAPSPSSSTTSGVALAVNLPSAPEPERTYVIFGTRRGGTSMVAGIARALGVDLGDPGTRKNNEDPRFQARPWRQLRESIAQRNRELPVWGWKYPAAATYLPDVFSALRNPYFIVVYRDPVAAALSQQRHDGATNGRTSRLALHESDAHNTMNTGFVLSTDRPCLLISNELAVRDQDGLIDEVARFVGVPAPQGTLRQQIRDYLQPGQYKAFEDFVTLSA